MTMMLAACGHPSVLSCPSGEPLEVDLDAWREAMHGTAFSAPPGAATTQDRLLAALDLAPVSDGVREEVPGKVFRNSLSQLEVGGLRNGAGGELDWLVAARFRGPSGAESFRAQVLRPVAGRENLYCPLGDDLSHDKESFEEPCLQDHDGPARRLTVEALVAPSRDAIVVRDAGGWCGPGTNRGDRFATSYWGIEQGRLVRYLEVVTHEARYGSPAPPSEIRRAEIALSASWPRIITVTETVECPPYDGPSSSENGCRPAVRITQYRYTDGRYAAVPEAAVAPADQGAEETTP